MSKKITIAELQKREEVLDATIRKMSTYTYEVDKKNEKLVESNRTLMNDLEMTKSALAHANGHIMELAAANARMMRSALRKEGMEWNDIDRVVGDVSHHNSGGYAGESRPMPHGQW